MAIEEKTPSEPRWAIVKGRPRIRVVSGLSGEEICILEAAPDWKRKQIKDAVCKKTSISGTETRLLWKGLELKPGALPAELMAQDPDLPVELKMVRVDPTWSEALDKLLEDFIGGPYSTMVDDDWIESLAENPLDVSVTNAVKTLPLDAEHRAFALAAVQHSGSILSRCSEELLNDREFVLAAVRESGVALQYVPEALRHDREVTLTAVRCHGEALAFAPKELQCDKDVVLEALAESGEAIRYASPTLLQEKDFFLDAFQRSAAAFRAVPQKWQLEKEFVLQAVAVNRDVLRFAPEVMRTNRDIAIAARKERPPIPPEAKGNIKEYHNFPDY
eukprot:TRINITY_DN49034_c0_g1_i1.p1 TRINITY_DN49034_c0_g1~~TRINITY_DN49034_c0_g1_i1.p1  ORF type:complete len:345 (+),score=68.31 TRINITY_DN49034_c0_g1_i1:42-1037(+)